jgi:hypothetical protein
MTRHASDVNNDADDAMRRLNAAEAYKNAAKRRLNAAEAYKNDAKRRLDEALSLVATKERRATAAEEHLYKLRTEKAAPKDIESAEKEVDFQRGEVAATRGAANNSQVSYDSAFALYKNASEYKRLSDAQNEPKAVETRPLLDAASLESVVSKLATECVDLFKQPSPPSSLPLWWRLGAENLRQDVIDLSADNKPHVLVGLSGSGKTRAMYELLSTRFGFYWTCGIARNGGASIASDLVDNLPQGNSQPNYAIFAVKRLITLFSVMFLAWRRVRPDGTPLDWLVFQTTNVNVSVGLAEAEKGNIDVVVDAVSGALSAFSFVLSASFVLATVNASISGAGHRLVVVVDEAQTLADTKRVFKSTTEAGALRSALSSWAAQLHNLGTVWWLAGTSLSLRNAEIIARSVVSKPDGHEHVTQHKRGADNAVHVAPLAFDQFDAYSRHVRAVVGSPLDALESSEVLRDVFDMFRGRARPVTLFAHEIRKLSNKQEPLTPDAVWQVALGMRSKLTSPNDRISFAVDIKRKLKRAEYKDNASALGAVVQAMMMGNADALASALKQHVELFESAIGQLVVTESGDSTTLSTVECVEPLAQAAVFIAFITEDTFGVRGLNPVLGALQDMAMWSAYNSAIGFMAEALVAPFVHHYFRTCIFREPAVNVNFVTARCDDIAVALHLAPLSKFVEFAVFAPKLQAHPDWIHTFQSGEADKDSTGLIGQVKFTRSMTQAQWDHAVRATSRRALFCVDAVEDGQVLDGFEAERAAANAAMTERWPKGYASYVFTLAEPPSGVTHRQMVGDRELFVFSPKLCPQLFAPIGGDQDVWGILRKIKQPNRPIVAVAEADKFDFMAATLFPQARIERVMAYREKLLAHGCARNELWPEIVRQYPSFVRVERPEWLID